MSLRQAVGNAGRTLDLLQRWVRFKVIDSAVNPWRVPTLDHKLFRESRVIIIGPASSVFEDLGNLNVDSFDFIVRLNNGIALALENPKALGTRTDVLFHNLNETGPRNAGAIPVSLLSAHKVRLCVFPHWSFRGSKSQVFRKKEELRRTLDTSLVVLPSCFCQDVRTLLDGRKPTTGTSALLYFLRYGVKELQVHGFTFFETSYVSGYNPNVATPEDAANWVAASNTHDPKLEKLLVRKAVMQARGRGMTVNLGVNVARHLA